MGAFTANDGNSVDQLPSILFVGVEGVGKRSIVSSFFPRDDREGILESAYLSPLLWTIDTKYYTADVTLQIAGISRQDSTSGGSTSLPKRHAALVMVFDVTQAATFGALQQWAARLDLTEHDILLCIGNKVDKVSSHPAHTLYRRRRLARGDAGIVSAPDIREVDDFGVQRSEGSAFLNNDEESEVSGTEEEEEEPQVDLSQEEQHRKVTEWCADNCVEYIESCGVDPEFDKAISVDSEEQGVARIKSALAAHLWPGHRRKEQGLSLPHSELRPGTNSSRTEDDQGDGSEEDSESEGEGFGYELLGVDDGHDNWESFDPQQRGEGGPTCSSHVESLPPLQDGTADAALSEKVIIGVDVADVVPENDRQGTNWQSAPSGQTSSRGESGEDLSRGFSDEPEFKATPPLMNGYAAENDVRDDAESRLRGRSDDSSLSGFRKSNGRPHDDSNGGPPAMMNTISEPSSVHPDAHGVHDSVPPSASSAPASSLDCSNDEVATKGTESRIRGVGNIPSGSDRADGHNVELDGSRIVHGELAYDEELRAEPMDPPGASSFEALERMMGEMSAMRSNLRGMPDETRKEMAARMACRLADMFDDSDGDE